MDAWLASVLQRCQDDGFVARVSVIRASNGEERTAYWHSPDGATWGRLGTAFAGQT